MNQPWRPVDADPALFDSLHEGIPPWMVAPFWEWVGAAERALSGWTVVSMRDFAMKFDRESRNLDPLAPRVGRGVSVADQLRDRADFQQTLTFTDYLVYQHSQIAGDLSAEELEIILVGSGSAWRVGTRADSAGLQRRVPEGVQVAAETIIATSATAGSLLAEGWHAAFGRSPDPEEAYEKAIKAVEAAGAHVVAPRSTVATLGTMVRDMEAQSVHWRLPLIEVETHPSNDVVLMMARALWFGQGSRHGGNKYRKPSQSEAESAVLLAVPLVQWFVSGILPPRPA